MDRDGVEVGLGPRLQRTLLAILVVDARHVVPVDRLIDLLWREEPPAAALASLQAYISLLRRILEPGRLDELFATGGFRFANHLSAWIDVEDGRITQAGYTGRGYISRTRVGPHQEVTFQPAEFPEIRTAPEITPRGARFTQPPAAGPACRPPAGQRQALRPASQTSTAPGCYRAPPNRRYR